MEWSRTLGLSLAMSMAAACQAVGSGDPASGPDADLAGADREQARIVQSADLEALAELLHPDYAAHLANGQLFDRAGTLRFAAGGRLAAERFERVQERVIRRGEVGIVMGVDRLAAPPPLAQSGERTRRYTNIYVRDGGRWKLIARHFHLLP